jgi:hypothetical protein
LLELETNMTDTIGRRDLLKRSAAFAEAFRPLKDGGCPLVSVESLSIPVKAIKLRCLSLTTRCAAGSRVWVQAV